MLHEVDQVPGQHNQQEELVRRDRGVRLEVAGAVVVHDVGAELAVPKLAGEPHAALAGAAGRVRGAGGAGRGAGGAAQLRAPVAQPQQAGRARGLRVRPVERARLILRIMSDAGFTGHFTTPTILLF